MRIILALLVWIISYQYAGAQEGQYIWQPRSSFTIKGKVPFSRVKVEDVRLNKENLGTLNWGGEALPVVTEEELGAALTKYAAEITKNAIKGERELLIVLHELEVARVFKKDVCELLLHVDLFLQFGDGYKLLHKARTYTTFRVGKDKQYHLSMADEVFKDIIAVTQNPEITIAEDAALFTKAEALNHPKLLRDKTPLYNSSKPI